jgi:lambda family phage tail tape measure protein
LANNETTVVLTADSSGYVAALDKAVKSNDALRRSVTSSAEVMQAKYQALTDLGEKASEAQKRQAISQVNSFAMMAATAGKTTQQIALMRAEAAGAGNAVKGFAEQVAKGMNATHSGMAGISRELMVMSHEALTGNFKRLGGSAMVLGERLNVLKYLFSPLSLSIMTAAGAAAAFAAVANKGEEEARQFAAALQMTGNYSGLTADRLATMAAALSSTTGSGLGKASEVLRGLAASGQYTAEQMRGLATVMLDTSRVTGQSLEDVSKLYEGLSKDPAKWAQEHIGSMHNMNVATLEHVEALQRAGDKYAAFDAVVDSLLQQVQDSSQQHLSAAAKAWDSFTSSIDASWQAMKRIASGHETIADQINALKAQRADVAASPAALQSIDASIAALEHQRRQMQQNADQVSAYQQVQDRAVEAEARIDKMREQFATNAEKRAKELAQLQKDRDAVVAGGGAMPDYDQRVADINEKYKDRSSTTKGQVSSINADASSALALRKLVEQQAQQQLQFQRQMGLVSAQDYYNKLHDIEAAALQDEINTEEKRVNALSKFQGSAAYKEAAGKLAELKQQMAGLDQTRDNSIAESRRQDSLGNQQFQSGLNDEVSKQAAGFSQAESTQLMSAQMKQEYDARFQIIEQFEQRVQQLKEQYARLPQDKQQELQDRLQSLQQAKDTELQQYQAHLDKMQQMRDSFSDQMTSAMNRLVGNGQTAAEATAEAFTQAWQDSTNALNTFLTTGKGNFDQFAAGVLADMAKIALQ